MSSNPNIAVMKTARFLNVALNIVIAILVFFLIAVILMPMVGEEVAEGLRSKNGSAPSIFALNMSGSMGGSLILIAYLFAALVVKKIVKTTMIGNPFVPENISRLRKTWIIIALAEILRSVVSFVVYDKIDIPLSSWFLVFVIAIMAEVFRIGLELKRDQELTV